jgi:serine protease Do
VTRVVEGSPADKAGLKEDDFVTKVGGKATEDVDELRNRVAQIKPGETVDLEVRRAGKVITVPVKVSEQPADMYSRAEGRPAPAEPSRRYGLTVTTLTDELAKRSRFDEGTKGVLITEVAQDSDAAEKGIRAGMVIDRVNRKTVTTAAEFAEAVAGAKDAKSLLVRVLTKDGARQYVILEAR